MPLIHPCLPATSICRPAMQLIMLPMVPLGNSMEVGRPMAAIYNGNGGQVQLRAASSMEVRAQHQLGGQFNVRRGSSPTGRPINGSVPICQLGSQLGQWRWGPSPTGRPIQCQWWQYVIVPSDAARIAQYGDWGTMMPSNHIWGHPPASPQDPSHGGQTGDRGGRAWATTSADMARKGSEGQRKMELWRSGRGGGQRREGESPPLPPSLQHPHQCPSQVFMPFHPTKCSFHHQSSVYLPVIGGGLNDPQGAWTVAVRGYQKYPQQQQCPPRDTRNFRLGGAMGVLGPMYAERLLKEHPMLDPECPEKFYREFPTYSARAPGATDQDMLLMLEQCLGRAGTIELQSRRAKANSNNGPPVTFAEMWKWVTLDLPPPREGNHFCGFGKA